MFKLLHKTPDFQINRVLDFKHLGFKLEPWHRITSIFTHLCALEKSLTHRGPLWTEPLVPFF